MKPEHRTPNTSPSCDSTTFTRRDFLKLAGFTLAAGTLTAGCSRAPVEKIIPFLDQPPEMRPGKSLWYASVCPGCPAGCGVLVKVRDGRPIKLEGNPDHPVSKGGLCPVGQAAVLGVYDSRRLAGPRIASRKTGWNELDAFVTGKLENIRTHGGKVRFLCGTDNSPTVQRWVKRFLSRFKDARLIAYDPLSVSAIPDAHEKTHRVRVLPHYRFDRAQVIVSFDADFLGTWISPVEFTADYMTRRDPARADEFSHHTQFESRLSITGAKADRRIRANPDEIDKALAFLARRVAEATGGPVPHLWPDPSRDLAEEVDRLAKRLLKARGQSLVVCGRQDTGAQILCNSINHALGNYGATLDLANPSRQKLGRDRELAALLDELDKGEVAALFVHGVNPVCDLPGGDWIKTAMEKVPLTVCFADQPDETGDAANVVCATGHSFEYWSDSMPVEGIAAINQPVLRPFGDTRSVAATLAAWSGETAGDHELVRQTWREELHPKSASGTFFEEFWDRTLHDGYATLVAQQEEQPRFDGAAVTAVLPEQPNRETASGENPAGFALVLYPKVTLLDGRMAWNPLLQELPDPISKVSWDNYAALSPRTAFTLGVKDGDVVRIETESVPRRFALGTVELPVLVQAGMSEGAVAVAVGYGRKTSARFETAGPKWLEARKTTGENGLVGMNAAPLLDFSGGLLRNVRKGVRLTRTGRRHELAFSQEYHRADVPEHLAPPDGAVRPIILESSLDIYQAHPETIVRRHSEEGTDLWPEDHPYKNHHWGMAIDLNRCTGCSACMVACQVENNVPAVGKDEVRRNRELHWLRIDRYYSGPRDGSDVDVAFQPVMCQQCGHAPCETVCPVLATVHSSEGLNTQVYNRCVGTRYCANNCPYKMRRFNWFNYARGSERERLALNPDVTVRSRGIMEKCTFCVQRIQEAKLEAKRRGRPVRDGEAAPACMQSCPAGAIVFGDLNDQESRVSKLMASPRRYKLLEELNVRPSVGYLALIRNREASSSEVRHG